MSSLVVWSLVCWEVTLIISAVFSTIWRQTGQNTCFILIRCFVSLSHDFVLIGPRYCALKMLRILQDYLRRNFQLALESVWFCFFSYIYIYIPIIEGTLKYRSSIFWPNQSHDANHFQRCPWFVCNPSSWRFHRDEFVRQRWSLWYYRHVRLLTRLSCGITSILRLQTAELCCSLRDTLRPAGLAGNCVSFTSSVGMRCQDCVDLPTTGSGAQLLLIQL